MKIIGWMSTFAVGLIIATSIAPEIAKADYCGNFWMDDNYSGSKQTICSERAILPGWFNDQISSYRINPGAECIITEDANFGGDYDFLGPGEARSLVGCAPCTFHGLTPVLLLGLTVRGPVSLVVRHSKELVVVHY